MKQLTLIAIALFTPTSICTAGSITYVYLIELAVLIRGEGHMPTHHSPFFKIDPDSSIPVGVASTILAIKSVMPN